MSGGARSRFPFTASQWQELEHQALIFKYMVSGMSIPPDLLHTVRRSLDSSISSKLLLHHQPQLEWNCFQMGFGRKIDPEPGRCRRTDGKKWRCSKEAYPDSKYCERHMHRGRNRSRKPVELISTPLQTSLSSSNTNNITPASSSTAIPIKTNTRFSPSSPTSHHSLSSLGHSEPHHPPYATAYNTPDFLYFHSSHENGTANFLLDSNKGYRDEVDQEHAFFSEASGAMRNVSGSESSWQLSPLAMGSPLGHVKRSNDYADYFSMKKQQQYYPMGGCAEEAAEPKKVMHHFFDEWPKEKDHSWLDSSEDSHSKIQLSISMPNSHDLFMARNDKQRDTEATGQKST